MMKLNFVRMVTLSVLSAVIILTYSCNDNNPADLENGTLSVKITDAPFPIGMVEYAKVTIDRVEVRSVSSDSGSPFITLTDEDFSATFDLLQLQNGVTGDVIEAEIPTGSYDLVRLYVENAEIKVKDGEVYYLKVPSGAQTGIKVFVSPAIEVAGGLSAELLLDMNISKSFVVQGNPKTPAGIKGFHFKPVVRAINRTEAGRISGLVKDNVDIAIENATVFTEIAPEDTLRAFTDSDGFYALVGLQPGTYIVSATEAGHDTVTVSDVIVTAGNNTAQDFVLTPNP